MTGTTSGMGRTFMEFDTYKNQEWLRRRKLRLEQVRKQSNEIAKALRQKVIDDEKARLDEYERMSETNIRDWKAEKLAKLQWKLRSALEEFGDSHRQAEEESEQEEMIKEKNNINLAKAQKRGEIAHQEELRQKKMAEEKKLSPIQRKYMARKKEDLRSALICSLPLKKQFVDAGETCKEQLSPEKVPVKKLKQKKTTSHKSCLCKHKPSSSNSPPKGPETIWINLDKLQTGETSDSGLQLKMSKSSSSNEKSQKAKPEGTVEFYDFSSRYHSKTLREFPHLVERIDVESAVPNANELAQIEEKKEKEEAKKKTEVDTVSQERGMEALRREKIQRDYNNLIAKLEELNKKEKLLKVQTWSASRLLHMNDERLSERARNKQRMMDAKFESIYFEATAQLPKSELLCPFTTHSQERGDYAQFDEKGSIRLSFSSSRSSPETPIYSQEESVGNHSEEKIRRPRKTNNKQLLLNIDRTLKVGRELRKIASKNWGSKDFDVEEEAKTETETETENENEKSSPDSKTSEASPPKEESKMKCQESQTDDIKEEEKTDEKEELKSSDKTGDESLPISSATSYKSPPSVIRSHRLRQLISSLEKQNLSQVEKNKDELLKHPTLEYYIEKLLNMNREYIANLSVSSDTVSTPNITDFDGKDEKACDSSREEDIARKSTLNRANQLEETIRNWKKILGKNSEKGLAISENAQDSTQFLPLKGSETGRKSSEEPRTVCCTNVTSKYEEISKKCSERILELSDMLNKVRKDKEKLLSSNSGGSSISLNKEDEGMIEEESVEVSEEEEKTNGINSFDKHKAPPVFKSFICRFNLPKPPKETAVVQNPQAEESFDSWPDVMDELLKKEILSSPFKWSDGEFSSDFTKITERKPSSIETVIGNFRKEVKKIKPFSVSDSYPEWNSQTHSTLRHSFDEGCPDGPKNFLSTATENGSRLQEESSVESINHALTSLGLNWAKSFLRKNEESRAMSSSSNSVDKSSEDEDDFY